MLWRKAWAESRARFLLAVLVLAMISLFVIGWQDASRVLFGGVSRTIYMLFAIILVLTLVQFRLSKWVYYEAEAR